MGKSRRAKTVLLSIPIMALYLLLAFSSSYAIPLIPQFREPGARHRSAVELLKRNEFDKVIQIETRLLSAEPGDLTAYLVLTIAYLGKDDEKKALEQAEQVKRIDSKFVAEIYGSMGRFYLTKRRYHKGLVYFLESLKVKEDPEVIRHVAWIYLNQGLLKNAKAYYEKLLDSKPDYTNLSRIYLAEADYGNAIAYAQKAVKEDVKASGGYLVLGTGYILTDKPDLAKANFLILKDLNPEFFLTDYFLGIINIIQKNYAEALLGFKSVILMAPKLKEAHLYSAVIYHLTGDLNKAREAASKAIELDPLDPVSHLALGNIHISEKKYDRADQEYQKAGDLFPDLGLPDFKASRFFTPDDIVQPAYLTLSLLHIRAGLYREAVKAMDRIIQASPSGNPFYMTTKARAEAKLGNLNNAEGSFLAVTGKNPEFITSYIEMGDLAESKGDLKKAIELYKKASRAAPQMTRLNLRLADLYMKANDAGSAVSEYRKVISEAPESVAGYKYLARTLADSKNDLNEALKYAAKGASVNPEDMEMKDILGWIYYSLGRHDEALKAYSPILKNGTNNPVVYYHIGLVFNKLKKVNSALEAFEKALNLNDEFSKADETKEMLKKLSGLG